MPSIKNTTQSWEQPFLFIFYFLNFDSKVLEQKKSAIPFSEVQYTSVPRRCPFLPLNTQVYISARRRRRSATLLYIAKIFFSFVYKNKKNKKKSHKKALDSQKQK